jgi:hypothetical protein
MGRRGGAGRVNSKKGLVTDPIRGLCALQHYNSHRPHRGIDLNVPERNDFGPRVVPPDEIERTVVVGGLISKYHVEAA